MHWSPIGSHNIHSHLATPTFEPFCFDRRFLSLNVTQTKATYLHNWYAEGVAGDSSVGVVAMEGEPQRGGLAHNQRVIHPVTQH